MFSFRFACVPGVVVNVLGFSPVCGLSCFRLTLLHGNAFYFFFQLFQMFYQRRQYSIFENLLEWAVYVLAIIYVADEFDVPLVNR